MRSVDFFCTTNIPVMKLMMYIGNDLIEAVPVNDKDLRIPGYLGKFKRYLKQKYDELLKTSQEPPEFLVCNPEMKPDLPEGGMAG
ncbi:MAG TPA: hypothetical protein VMZ03_04690 [Chitinophagaceae bacterium]|nr:hypothetical protein [Chitinophagaceae bacterium]